MSELTEKELQRAEEMLRRCHSMLDTEGCCRADSDPDDGCPACVYFATKLPVKTPPTAIEETEEKKTLGNEAPLPYKAGSVETQNALLPCPFCGSGDANLLPPTCRPETPYNAADRLYPVVRCSRCYAEATGKNEDYKGNSALLAWNQRAASDPKGADSVGCGSTQGAPPVSEEVAAPPSSKSEEWTVRKVKRTYGLTGTQQTSALTVTIPPHETWGYALFAGNRELYWDSESLSDTWLQSLADAHNTSLSSLRSRCERLEREAASFK